MKSKLLFVVAVVAAIGILPATAVRAQTQTAGAAPRNTAVERPVMKVGDQWNYQVIDDWKHVVKETFSFQVSSVTDKETQVIRKAGSGAVATITQTPDLNVVSIASTSGNDFNYSPDNGDYAFPLVVGKTYAANASYTKKNGSGSYALNATVVGWEQVTVPAGTFTALKITREGFYKAATNLGSGTGKMKVAVWYVPELKAKVKVEYEDTDWSGHPASRVITELTGYAVH